MSIVDNIDWIIDNAPSIQRNEWDRRAIEVLKQARQALQHADAQVLDQQGYIRGLEWALDQTLPAYQRHAEHAPGCDDDPRHYPNDLDITDTSPCTPCDTQAVIRHICETETMPNLPVYLDELTRKNHPA